MKFLINIFFFFVVIFSSSVYAAPAYSCDGESLLNINAATTDQNDTYSENSNTNAARYFTFTPAVGGEMTVSYGQNAALTEEKQTLEIGTTCGGNEIYKDVSGKPSDTYTYYVSAGTTYYVKITEKNGSNVLRFTADFQFKAIKVGFEAVLYSLAEDIYSSDGATQPLELTIKLTHATTFPITVTYNSLEASPVSAILGVDFKAVSTSVTFAAGETVKKAYVDIIHDVAVELEENFLVNLSNIVTDAAYNGVVGFGDYNPTEIKILEQNAVRACFADDFSTALDADWRLLYSSGGFVPEIVNGRLRMTTATGNLATAVTKDWEFAASENLITIVFDHFAYEGNGADGFTLVLYDSSIGASPQPGAFGGSLGYAQRTGVPGFEGGWLGLGLDEFGNYANPTEGRDGGIGFTKNAVSIRGKGSGQTGYTYLAGTTSLSPVLWKSDSNYSGGRFKFTVDSRDTAHVYITLERDSDRDNTYESVIVNKFDAIGIQGVSPDYIRLAVTASTGGSNAIHELDDLVVSGVCRPYGLTLPTSSTGFVDAVDSTYTDATYTDSNGPDITTKVTNKGSYNFDAVYLGSDNTGVEVYSPTGTFDSLPLTVEITVADSACENEKELTAEDGSPFGWAEIEVGQSSATTVSPVTFPSFAMPDARLKLKALDWNSLFDSYGVSTSCSVSSTHGSLCGVPSCLGSATQVNQAFPATDSNGTAIQINQDILTECYGLASDGSGSIGTNSSCNGTNYNGSCGGINTTKTILPDKYSNKVGCLACIMDKLSQSTCSEDHFAIRPNQFAISSSGTDYPDLLHAGEDYNTTVVATNYATSTPTQDYNQSSSNLSTNGTIKWNKIPAVDSTLNGAATLGDFNITNGTSTYNGLVGEVATFTYSDVGLITLHIQDGNWSAIDSEDTVGDCSENGRYICGDKNVTFIPDHFTFVDLNVTNNNGNPGTFTYISNLNPADTSTFSMAVRIDTRVEARNKLNAVTQNFKNGANFYENPVSINISFNDSIHTDVNATNILASLLGFGLDNGDVNGTRTFIWNDDSNLSKVLRFNFSRDVNETINPFVVNGSDLNVTITSIYNGAAGTETISDDNSGISAATGSPTVVYGRTHASRQRYEVPVGGPATGTANIYYESYCFGTDKYAVDCNKSRLIPFSPNLQRTDDTRWFINTAHINADGNPGTVVEKDLLPHHVNAAAVITTTNPNTVVLTYDENQGYPYKTTMENNASGWLIYNEDDPTATRNQFSVEFEKAGTGWSGEHETNTTTKDTGNATVNRRSMW